MNLSDKTVFYSISYKKNLLTSDYENSLFTLVLFTVNVFYLIELSAST
jgi:hypothetical protein